VKKYKELCFDQISEDDIALLTPIMKRAFDEDTRTHTDLDSDGPTGYDDGSFLRKWIHKPRSISYKILADSKLIGCFVITSKNEDINYLEMLFLDPDTRNNNYGYIVWSFIESEFSKTRVWRTSTPGYSKRNQNFYINKCGFQVDRIEKPGNFYQECYHLKKIMF
jgi:hypothetical protein